MLTPEERKFRRWVFEHMQKKYRFEYKKPLKDMQDYLTAYYRYA